MFAEIFMKEVVSQVKSVY